MTTTTTTKTQSPLIVTGEITVPRGPVKASLVFYSPPKDGSTPFNYVEPQPEGSPQRNYSEDTHEVTINDMRGRESSFKVNTHGFTSLSNIPTDSPPAIFTDDAAITNTYYPEVESLLLSQLPGSTRIHIFDHTVRRSDPNASRQPVNRAHIDQTPASAAARVHRHMGDEAPELLKSRVRLINVWRPLNSGPVVSNPLAFADSRSVADKHVVGVEHRYPDRTGETAGVEYTESGNWYYLSGMENHERILLQCYDSQDGARTPHSAFVDPRTQQGWPGRESVEVRALVFG